MNDFSSGEIKQEEGTGWGVARLEEVGGGGLEHLRKANCDRNDRLWHAIAQV